MDDKKLQHGYDRCYIPGVLYPVLLFRAGPPVELWNITVDKRFGEYARGRITDIEKKQVVFKNISNIKQSIMKRIIYTAVALIICASVFGIADYLNAKEQGALVNYSDDVQTTEAVIPEKIKEPSPAPDKEKIVAIAVKDVKKESKRAKKIFKSKRNNDDRTGVISTRVVTDNMKEPVIEKMDITDLVLQSKVTDSIVKPDAKRKLSMEMFSRAPIKDKKITKK